MSPDRTYVRGLGQSRVLIFESSDQSGYEAIIVTAPANFDTRQEASERAWQGCYVVSICRRRQKQRSGQRRSSR
jgi:hypothetical protein